MLLLDGSMRLYSLAGAFHVYDDVFVRANPVDDRMSLLESVGDALCFLPWVSPGE